MIQNLLAASEFTYKLVGGLAGLAVAIAIIVAIIVVKNKKG